ncbi:hypothetical protein CR513_29021, partial [Mucuna pruriens]
MLQLHALSSRYEKKHVQGIKFSDQKPVCILSNGETRREKGTGAGSRWTSFVRWAHLDPESDWRIRGPVRFGRTLCYLICKECLNINTVEGLLQDNICLSCPGGGAMESESDFIPEGLLSNKGLSIAKVLDKDRWSQAEARTAELLTHIQPNQTSEAHRNAVVSYLRCLIMKCVPCQVPKLFIIVSFFIVFTFGSVPLKTYLPDGDIDLTAFGDNPHSEESLIQDVLCILESEEKNEAAEFQVKEVQYIQAEVKIIKSLTSNFLFQVGYLIKKNHLLKLSIILIKAWCYYESRILGSHHGLISTYALETLVIYVLLRFLDFFSKFDWNNYCISLRGPVPISSLPDMKAEPPRKNCQELLLSENFLNACEFCYGVMPSIEELKEKPFVSKYLNVVDPLRSNNNLGRSINKGNFCRIKSAINYGAKRIQRLLGCPLDNIIAEFDLFFKNTWDRNGNGYWLDTVTYNLYVRNNNVTSHESEVEQTQTSHGQNLANHSEESSHMFGASDVSAASQTWSSNNNSIFTGEMTSDIEHANAMNNALANRGQGPIYSSHGVHGMHHFPGFYAGSQFAHLYSEVPAEHFHNTRISSENQQSFGQIPYDWKSEYAFDPENTNYYYEYGFGVNEENVFSSDEAMLMHQEEHGFPTFDEHQQAPANVNSSDVSFPPPPPSHVLASRYIHENLFGVLPEDVPSFESLSGHNRPYSHDTASLPSEWFPSLRSTSSSKPDQPDGVSGNRIDQSNVGTDLHEGTSTEAITSYVQALQLGREVPKTVPNSSVPDDTSVHVAPPGSSQRAGDNQSLLPVAEGSSGPSFQVPTMFPFYNLPAETETTFAATNDVNMHAELGILYPPESSVILDPTHDGATSGYIVEEGYNILDGNFASYWVNLQYGRFCKDPESQELFPNPLSTALPMHLRGPFPWFRKATSVVNDVRPAHTPVPVMPSERASPLHGDTNERVAFWIPRFSKGTGTYLPNPTNDHHML